MIEYVIPPTLVQSLAAIPTDQPVALLLRHSVRDPIPEGETGNDLPLTDKGVEIARELGEKLKGRLSTLHTSPVRRCVQTAEHLRSGAGINCEIKLDRMLGDPGVFIEDAEVAGQNFQTREYWELIASLVRGEKLIGMRHGPTAARQLTEHMLARIDGKPGVHIFVTHDYFLATLAAVGLALASDESLAPKFLDGVFIWQDAQIHGRYKSNQGVIKWPTQTQTSPNRICVLEGQNEAG